MTCIALFVYIYKKNPTFSTLGKCSKQVTSSRREKEENIYPNPNPNPIYIQEKREKGENFFVNFHLCLDFEPFNIVGPCNSTT